MIQNILGRIRKRLIELFLDVQYELLERYGLNALDSMVLNLKKKQ